MKPADAFVTRHLCKLPTYHQKCGCGLKKKKKGDFIGSEAEIDFQPPAPEPKVSPSGAIKVAAPPGRMEIWVAGNSDNSPFQESVSKQIFATQTDVEAASGAGKEPVVELEEVLEGPGEPDLERNTRAQIPHCQSHSRK